ncbi:MAG: DNA primase [Anaerolineae bacterium]|nr:DNA primase [Anaerolineae bacterium]
MSVVEEIKDRLDLVEIIGRVIQLQKAGRNFKGLCPFHTEKTPSFFVFPDSQNWHCFGCGKGGDVFTFVTDYEGWDFRTALEELGRQAGVQISQQSETQVKAAQEADRLRDIMAEATRYYHALLKSAPNARRARDYLRKRGFLGSTVEQFQLGYSPESWDALRTHLLGQGHSIDDILAAGLVIERESGGTYDRFRDRIIIPIRDRKGRVIAFGGRVLSPEQEPKYMNSPQTPIFDKSRVLFGLDMAAQAIREADTAIIVEGYIDVMIPHQAGYKNVVAPMGTALTESHLQQLQRLTRRFIMALDPDAAGISATLRGLETARETLDRDWEAVFDARGLVGYEGRLNAEIRVVMLPEGRDPDELILENRDQWQMLLDQAQPIVRFVFDKLLEQENPGEPKGKARIVDAILPLLRDISNNVEREAYVQEIALHLGLDPRMLLDRLRARHDRVQAIKRVQAAEAATRSDLPGDDRETRILIILMRYPELLERLDVDLLALELDTLQDEDFTLSNRMIWIAWLELLADPSQEINELLPEDLCARVEAWRQITIPDLPIEEWERDALRSILLARKQRLRETTQAVEGLIREAQSEGDLIAEHYARVLKESTITVCHIDRSMSKISELLMRSRHHGT